MSDAAHDLKPPLEAIRSAVSSVCDGDLGTLSQDQRACLSRALDQCDCATRLIETLVQSESFQSGFVRVQRDWVSIDEIRERVESMLSPWSMPRRIQLLWDGPFGSELKVYADPRLLERLIVNLATNSIRASRDGGPVLIRAIIRQRAGEVLWAVVDQGTGIAACDLTRIASGVLPVGTVSGLGMSISRRLAAAHFSPLEMESRLGTGTAVSFRTPAGGPAAVAARWVLWRRSLIASNGREDRQSTWHVQGDEDAQEGTDSAQLNPPRRVRIDLVTPKIELRMDRVQVAFEDQVFLTTAAVGAAVSKDQANEFDRLIQRASRLTDFVYRAGCRRWVLALDADRDQGQAKSSELSRRIASELKGLRMTWGPSMVVDNANANDGHLLASRLTDLIVRQSLDAGKEPMDLDGFNAETAQIRPSSIPAQRLQKQLDFLEQYR